MHTSFGWETRLRQRHEGSIKTDLKEIWWDGVE